MDKEAVDAMLDKQLARELLHDAPVMHLAYAGRDGYPRVIPTGFVWKGGRLVIRTRTMPRKCPNCNPIRGSA